MDLKQICESKNRGMYHVMLSLLTDNISEIKEVTYHFDRSLGYSIQKIKKSSHNPMFTVSAFCKKDFEVKVVVLNDKDELKVFKKLIKIGELEQKEDLK